MQGARRAPLRSVARQAGLLPRRSWHLAPPARGADSRSVWGAGRLGARRCARGRASRCAFSSG
eukprot:2368484-Alexandrium_andersonii.AAC.1